MRNQMVVGLCVSQLVNSMAMASVNSDMNSFFNKLGFEGNATAAQAWQGQAAGYATGGNLFLRSQVKQLQIASFTPPSINAGCGGIDAYLGSLSHINSEQLQQFVKQLMTNGAGYFFDLALQTTVPELKSAKDFLQKMASDINSTNISSCQAAQGIIGGLWPTNTVQSQKICQDIAGETNMFADWAASRQGCTVGGKMNDALNRAPENMKDQVMKNKNLMWEILTKNDFLKNDTELKELVMNLTGTLIFDAKGNVKALIPKVNRQDIIKALMEGGTITLEGCVSTVDCLDIRTKKNTIDAKNGLNAMTKTMVEQIQGKPVDIPTEVSATTTVENAVANDRMSEELIPAPPSVSDSSSPKVDSSETQTDPLTNLNTSSGREVVMEGLTVNTETGEILGAVVESEENPQDLYESYTCMRQEEKEILGEPHVKNVSSSPDLECEHDNGWGKW